jgi:N-methylhydantoinase B/oxoprolinase/acetone carboxylase alpha subunit
MKSVIESFRASLPFTLNLAAKAAVVGIDGRVLSITEADASASVAASVGAVREFFGERWQTGDVAVLNDPDRGATHVCQLTAVAPINRQGKIAAWGVLRSNIPDLGGWHAGGYSPQAVDRWAEAARFEPAKLLLAGRVRREVADLLSLNSRTPKATRRLALALAEATLGLGKLLDLDQSEAAFQGDRSKARRALEQLGTREGKGAATIRTPAGIASPGEISVRLSCAAGKLAVHVAAPAISAHPVNLGAAAANDIVLSAVMQGLGVELKTGALLEFVETRFQDGLLAARVPACVGLGRETSGVALHTACATACSALNQRAAPNEAPAWLAREVAGDLDWSTGALSARSAAALLAAETEADR